MSSLRMITIDESKVSVMSVSTIPPNLVDYEAARASFSWDQARAMLDGLPGGRGLNIAHEAVDRHATGSWANHVALRFLTRDGGVSRADLCRAR